MRNALWESGYAIDTMETAIPWHATTATVRALEAAGKQALEGFGERCHAYTHLSHVYGSGSSAYSTFLFRVGPDQQSTYARWAALKKAVSEAIVASGGTITHQHGVGRDHAPFLPAEKGAVGMAAIEANFRHFDPAGVLASDNVTGPPA
jgi:alkyldihydroxyacetonephosphate synthase